MKYFTLSNGVEMPVFGLGTFMLEPPQAEASTEMALKMGYRLVDTANAYMNEKAVGRGMKKSGVAREEIFLSTKLWPSEYPKDGAVERTLARLGVDYVDLLYIHQPSGDYIAGYRQLEKAYKEGKARSIGISNFDGEALTKLLEAAEIKPHLIQAEAHPRWYDKETMSVLEPFGTRLMSWFPLGHGDKAMLGDEKVAAIAAKYGKTPAQIILRWHVEMGFCPIPGSKSESHIRENGEILDFELTAEDMNALEALYTGERIYKVDPAQTAAFANFAPPFDMQP